MLPLVILGHGAHARDIEDIALHSRSWMIVEHLDDFLPGHRPCNAPVEGATPYVIGVNGPQVRASLARSDLPAATVVHPRAVASMWAAISPGCVLAANAYLGPDVVLGRHVHIGVGANLASRMKVGDYCTISPGATICGDVTIGARTWIGAGATISNLVTIGNDVVVGAGAVVVRDVPDGITVAGVPAKELHR